MLTWRGTLIDSNIYVGPVHGLVALAGKARAIVFCAEELQPTPYDAQVLGVKIISCPLDDDPTKPVSLKTIVRVMKTAQQIADESKRGPVAVTCHMGINRSAMVAAAALMIRLNISGAEAVKLVRSRRPGTLQNRRFLEFLRAQPAPRAESVSA